MGNKRFLLIIMLCSTLLGGCALFPEPRSLIQPPKQTTAVPFIEEDDVMHAKKYLPNGTELAQAHSPTGTNGIIAGDIDGDEQLEWIVLYHSKSNPMQVGFFILKKEEGKWQKVYSRKGAGFDIRWASVADLTGDGKGELLLGWKIGESAGNVLEIYKWEKNSLVQQQKINYHELQLIKFQEDAKVRLATWNRSFADVFDVKLWKWSNRELTEDDTFESYYFTKVADYYRQRAEEVPDASYYWYYLADSELKANRPTLALVAIDKALSLKANVLTYEQMEKLKEQINKKLTTSDVTKFTLRDAHLTVNIPNEMAANIIIEEQSRNDLALVSSIYLMDQGKKELLFTIETYAKDMVIGQNPTPALKKIAETEQLTFFVNKGEGNRQKHISSNVMKKALNEKNAMIKSIQVEPSKGSYVDLEEELVLKKVKKAVKKYWHVMGGGNLPNGVIKSFSYKDTDYRYMGSDIGTMDKLYSYLSDVYTKDAIQSLITRAKFIVHNDTLAQPNADGGSLANFDYAKVLAKTDKEKLKEYTIKVPLGNSLAYEMIRVAFEKTEDGWLISQEPGTFN